MRLKSLLLASLLALPTPALAQALTPAETAKVDAIVADALKSTGAPSASVAIVRDGQIVFARAYGNQGPDVPKTNPDARYQIASISKQFTAAAILLLEDEGKLSLDDKVSKWVPDVTDADKITIRQLLSHTSGLQDYWPQDYSFAAMEKPVTPQGIVDRWAKKPLDFAPGTQWQYSNTGYVVAGMIIEKAAGEPLLSYLDRKIFKPLGMHPINQDVAVGPGFPTGYHRYALGPVRPEKQAASGWLWAAGELAMSASDLARWDIARIDRKVLTPEDWQTQETPILLADGSSSKYGLGVAVAEQGGVRLIEHGGEAVGFLSDNIVAPERRFAVVALVNADFGNAQDTISHGISRMMLQGDPQSADMVEYARAELAKQVYAGLQQGKIDRSLLTGNNNYYFTPEAVADYSATLAPLGAPQSFEASKPRLRGGFVNRNYTLTYPGKKLRIITYAEPGKDGKIEQFLVQPAD